MSVLHMVKHVGCQSFWNLHSIAKSRAQRTTVFCILTGVKDDRDMMAFSYLPWESLQQEKVEKQVVSFAAM